MQARIQVFLESELLFSKVKAYWSGDSEILERDESIQLGDLNVSLVKPNPQTGEGRRAGILLDEVYADLVSQRPHYDGLAWYNPSHLFAPEEMPEQDFDIPSLEQLRTVVTFPPRPSVIQCLDWWKAWEMPENVCRHVTSVAEAAYKLAIWLRQAGLVVDPILTHRAGLMHDLDKIKTLHQPGRHGNVSADFLGEQGYPELAGIVRNHLLGVFLNQDMASMSWETKLVNFCDKLVEGDQIVSIPERFSALKQRYPHSQVLIDSSEPYLWRLNDEICSILSLKDHDALVLQLNN